MPSGTAGPGCLWQHQKRHQACSHVSVPLPCPPASSLELFQIQHLLADSGGGKEVSQLRGCGRVGPFSVPTFFCIVASKATTQWPITVLGRGVGRSPKAKGRRSASFLSPQPQTLFLVFSWFSHLHLKALATYLEASRGTGSLRTGYVPTKTPPPSSHHLHFIVTLHVFSLTAIWITILFGNPRCSPSVALKSSCTQFRYDGSPGSACPLGQGYPWERDGAHLEKTSP